MALAMLDAILSPDWEARHYSFNRRWGVDAGLRMASMRNGSGDDYFTLFLPDGTAAVKGFAHESSALAGRACTAGVFDGLPARLVEVDVMQVAAPAREAGLVEIFEDEEPLSVASSTAESAATRQVSSQRLASVR